MKRDKYLRLISDLYQVNPIVAIVGPRQIGKTTLAKIYSKSVSQEVHYFDLEDPADLVLFENPKNLLSFLKGIVVIDEIQRKGELFPLLRFIVDNNPQLKFLILGSASPQLIKKASDSLAGRISYIELPGFSYEDGMNLDNLWVRGGFPKSFLSANDKISYQWRQDYIRSFVEIDIAEIANIPKDNLKRFWYMLAHYHGQIFNSSEISKSLGISHVTAKKYLDILSGTFMVRNLNPWHENLKKRQVKSGKIYFRDCGLLHNLLNIKTKIDLMRHPKLGASWEGFALEEIAKKLNLRNEDMFFWSTSNNAELDLLTFQDGKRMGYEFKFSDKPNATKSSHIVLQDLKLDELHIVHPGENSYQIHDQIYLSSLKGICTS